MASFGPTTDCKFCLCIPTPVIDCTQVRTSEPPVDAIHVDRIGFAGEHIAAKVSELHLT